jgi:hypothetical protein
LKHLVYLFRRLAHIVFEPPAQQEKKVFAINFPMIGSSTEKASVSPAEAQLLLKKFVDLLLKREGEPFAGHSIMTAS